MAAPTKSSAPAARGSESSGGGIIDFVFGFIEKYGMALLTFGTVIFFLWMLYSIDFSSVK